MYELFVLGQLMDRPMTGYQLRKALSSTVGPELTISFGALYPLLDKLAAAGTLTLAFKSTTTKRPQKVATITSAGRTRFHALVLAPVAHNKQTQLTFQMKVNFLHLLTPDQQRTTLRDFQTFATSQLDQLATQKINLAHNTNMVAADIQDALRVNQLQTVRAQAQADWLTTQLSQLTKE
ncbi:PadR family transcriptional regulator [Levilactobacillus acidifarinae]|uniref:Transcription regulator, padr family n=1 Tax=Levilactobacillus acidifarinae DSM 19394 = JCM 15949 TaxID=1423715 RepID=A0A0R1LHN1_9LACO|nr:PadR family transcriptional regulator [Levilactobacillus acidifarinae]KRK95398.1 transcription regulator, padr family [Levilactobacillus acidifarinae DSM 19394]GEO70009.1 PadR family transcriptional regulator [Levilactobacillus acidifarinae]